MLWLTYGKLSLSSRNFCCLYIILHHKFSAWKEQHLLFQTTKEAFAGQGKGPPRGA